MADWFGELVERPSEVVDGGGMKGTSTVGQVSGPGSKTRRGAALAAAVAALLCVVSPVPAQILENRWYGWGGITYTWYLPLCGLILLFAVELTLLGRSRPLGVGLIFGAALAVVPNCDPFWWDWEGGYAAAGITVTALIAAISAIAYFAHEIRGDNLRAPLAVAYCLTAIGLVVTVVIESHLFGFGPSFESDPLWIGESIVALAALAAPAVICGLLPPGTGLRAGSIIGWLAAIGAFLITQSTIASHQELTTPAFWLSRTIWVITLAVGIALLADDHRRALSAR